MRCRKIRGGDDEHARNMRSNILKRRKNPKSPDNAAQPACGARSAVARRTAVPKNQGPRVRFAIKAL
jgi:hypothetical protein